MGGLYLYAIVDGPEVELPTPAGVDGGAASGVRSGELQAVVSPLAGGHVGLTKARLLQHEAVIEALMERHTVLPARFGTLASEPQLLQALERHSALFAANLARVRGRVEVGLRAVWASPEPPPLPRPREADRADGRAYMRALLAEAQRDTRRRERAEALEAQLAVALADLADEETHELPAAPRPLLKAAYLVRSDRVGEVRRRIVQLGAAHPDLALLATGPWPAYSFTDVQQQATAPTAALETRPR